MWDLLLKTFAAVAATLLAGIVLGISANVVLRNLFDAPIYGLLDLVEYGLLLVTCLGAPWVLSQGAHVVVDLVTGAVPEQIARVLSRVTATLGCGVALVMVWYSVEAARISFGRGSMIRTAFVIPEWWVLSVMPLTFGLIAGEFLRQILHPHGRRADRSGL